MADLTKHYPSASALGTSPSVLAPRSEHRERFDLVFRDGTELSYPYRFVSLIETKSQSEVLLGCTCGHISTITIKGRNLAPLASALTHQTLGRIQENDRADFTESNNTVVEEITVTRPAGR
jgi:hypothetical protein